MFKTINNSNIDLGKFPACKVRQLVKKMESSKVTTRHIKEVAADPQAAQINLMWHQCTDLPASKHKKKKSYVKPKPPSHKNNAHDKQPIPSYHNKKSFDPKNGHKNKERCQKCGDPLHQKVSSVQQKVPVQDLP